LGKGVASNARTESARHSEFAKKSIINNNLWERNMENVKATEAVCVPKEECVNINKNVLKSWVSRLVSMEIRGVYAANLVSVMQEMEKYLIK